MSRTIHPQSASTAGQAEPPAIRNGARRNVAVVMPTHMTCYRDILRGINAFANAHGSWQVYYHTPAERLPYLLDHLQPEGLLLGPLANDQQSEEVKRALPRVSHCIGLCAWHADEGITNITEFESDDHRVGQVAAQHFLQKGYRDFAFLGMDFKWSALRAAGFCAELQSAGFRCAQ